MKSLGIVRKIDDLGRIVIPKEVRNTQGWEPGQPMEMFISDEGLVIRKYKSAVEEEEILKELKSLLKDLPSSKANKVIQKAIDYIKQK